MQTILILMGCFSFVLGGGVEVVPAQPDFDVSCDIFGFFVKIKKSAVPFYKEEEITLSNTSCAAASQREYYVITSRMDECGTVVSQDNDVISFKNTIIGKPDPPEKIITKKAVLQRSVFCIFNRKMRTLLPTYIQPSLPLYDQTDITSNARYTVSLQLSDKTGKALAIGEVLAVVTGERIYFSILSDAPLLIVSADHCYVTPTTDPDDLVQYSLIIGGCAVDHTVIDHGPLDNGRSYSFESFAFVEDTTDPLYLHCNAVSCPATDLDSVCVKGCEMNMNKKRSTARRALAKKTGFMSALILTKRM